MYGAKSCSLAASENGEREREVASWLRSLDYSTERLGNIVSTLADRLGPVLSPASPKGDGEASCPAGCWVALEIQSKVARLNAVESALNDLLLRLEV